MLKMRKKLWAGLHWIALAICPFALSCATLHAEEPAANAWTFKSAKAKEALRKYGEARQKLDNGFEEKRKENRAALIAQLEAALKTATQAGDLDDAVAIREAIKVLRNPEPADVEPVAGGQPQTPPAENGPTVRLSTLPVTAINDVSGITTPNQLWKKISFGGQVIEDGIHMTPMASKPALVSFRLGGKFHSVSGKVGIDDDLKHSGSAMPVTFAIFGDRKLLWKSKPVQGRGEIEEFQVKVSGVTLLTLGTETGKRNQWAHARWGDVQLIPRVQKTRPAP